MTGLVEGIVVGWIHLVKPSVSARMSDCGARMQSSERSEQKIFCPICSWSSVGGFRTVDLVVVIIIAAEDIDDQGTDGIWSTVVKPRFGSGEWE